MTARPPRTLRVCALYPDLMNIYADRGNLLLLERRCAWRGIGFEVRAASLGDDVEPAAHDLFYLGGGQDRDQKLCAYDLVERKRDALHAAAADARAFSPASRTTAAGRTSATRSSRSGACCAATATPARRGSRAW